MGADAALALAIAGRSARVSVIGVAQSRAFPFDMTLAQVKYLEFTAGLKSCSTCDGGRASPMDRSSGCRYGEPHG